MCIVFLLRKAKTHRRNIEETSRTINTHRKPSIDAFGVSSMFLRCFFDVSSMFLCVNSMQLGASLLVLQCFLDMGPYTLNLAYLISGRSSDVLISGIRKHNEEHRAVYRNIEETPKSQSMALDALNCLRCFFNASSIFLALCSKKTMIICPALFELLQRYLNYSSAV